MYHYVLSVLLILLVLSGWVVVQRIAQGFARRHPELGPHGEAMGCGFGCGHCNGPGCSSETRDPP